MNEGAIIKLLYYSGVHKPTFWLLVVVAPFKLTLRKNPGHSDVIYVVENVLNYFLVVEFKQWLTRQCSRCD